MRTSSLVTRVCDGTFVSTTDSSNLIYGVNAVVEALRAGTRQIESVTVRGQGLGGRNQEMALACAIAMSAMASAPASCFASVATDGTDGPTTAAGGLVDPFTCSRGMERGLQPLKSLAENDSWNFLTAAGDLVVTGPTQTNLMDLQMLLVG